MNRRNWVWVCVGALVFSLAGCASGPSARIKNDPETFSAFPQDVQENVRLGRIELGYTKEMVAMALGEPDRRLTRQREGAEERVWIYTEARPSVGLSFGTGFSTGSRGRTTGVGAGVGTRRDRAEETMRVVFSEGEVTGIEKLD